MYIIGERINGMFKNVRAAIEERDKKVIQDLALAEVAAGADALDINVGPAKADPLEALYWLVDTVREVSDKPLAIDNPKWELMEKVIPRVKGNGIINSCKADPEQLEKYLGLAVENGVGLIALTIDQRGVPADTETRVELGAQIGAMAQDAGLPMHDLFIDPVILPVNVAPKQPENLMAALRQLAMLSDPAPHFVVGLSNVSQNCSNRHLINRTYLVMAMTAGLDAAIVDPLDTELMNQVITTELLQEKMIYCDSYLDAYRMAK